MKLACDIMLGKLARWLRICGVDTFYDASVDRARLFRIAREEGRTVLTRAGNYAELKDIPPYIYVESENLADQLKQLKHAFPSFDPFRGAFTRCLECNVLLKDVDKESIKEEVPPKSYNRHDKFYRCPSCQKVFWPGTHLDRMTATIKRLFQN